MLKKKSSQSMAIKLQSFDHRILDHSVRDIVLTAKRTGAVIKGPVPLPTRKVRYVVNRSPHIDKTSREQYEIRTSKRLVNITECPTQTVEALMQLELPAGVDVKIKVAVS